MTMEVGLLFSKNGFLAFNKPAGMCTTNQDGEHTTDIPQLREMIAMYHQRGYYAHRIDRYTSGINLAGAAEPQVRYLMSNWHKITRKSYLAIIENPEWNEKVMDIPVNGDESATTSFMVIERSKSFALVMCQLVKNGRTHQIRQHLMRLKLPIVGDLKYGGLKTRARAGQLLHAWQMEVKLPGETSWNSIQAPIPDDFKQFDFDWDRWNAGASLVLDVWQVPTGWRR